ncbi:vWA domain-containing protein [Persicirhabdus sediminis]|uniref:VWA domain-containing protein n=1 Tax=Persicirhabdus sediminis TaxID=454144 RepID=A0A8J7MB26_9BACT|nr:vWA domain-containing protein [Persicirhabdus sediminis]MBK1790157.1 VWA domain-containing protein [Persicirhabdus sediminis]
MAIHASLSPEALSALHKQQRNSAISSGIIALLTIVLAAVILTLLFVQVVEKDNTQIVSYTGSPEAQEETMKKRQINRQIERTPSSPSSSQARVIAANTVSNIAVPVPEKVNVELSEDYGDGDDFGSGWGSGDSFGGGGGPTFFGQKVSGGNIVYIIDYSGSMKGRREQLMRDELCRSISELAPGTNYQLIFFAGPTWIAGDEVIGNCGTGDRTAEVKSKGGKTYKYTNSGGWHGWNFDGKKVTADWLTVKDSNIKNSINLVRDQKLINGTVWKLPLEVAIDMKPKPDTIIFMTDGIAGKDSMEVAEEYAKQARRKKITINAIALMEPKAYEAMKVLAEETGGTFALINSDGKKEDVKK